VQKLLTSSEFPVEPATTEFFFREIWNESSQLAKNPSPSYFVSLAPPLEVRKITVASRCQFCNLFIGGTAVRHSFERIIAGRPFVIEVTWVAEKRWRAHIVRIPGVPTAMMPFYGETPDEAATHLSDWLNRAHQHQANTV
jgi:hypothetical protein